MNQGGGRARSAPAFLGLLVAAACAGRATPSIATLNPSTTPRLQLRQNIDAILDATPLTPATWGIAVRSLSSGEQLYAHNAGKLLLPASNMKLVTLAAAAERLGWAFSFQTELVGVGPIDGGVLYGDLLVVGDGDPTIDDWDGKATALFTGWALQLKARGVAVVTGAVVGNDNLLPDQLIGAGWAWDDLDRSFATAAGALQFNQNTARLTVAPGAAVGHPGDVSVQPAGSGLALRNLVRTSAPEIAASIETRRGAGSAMLEVRGSLPLGAPPLVRNVSAHNPTLYFASALREALIAAGVEIRGRAIDVDDLADPPVVGAGTVLVSHRSAPLSEIAVTMMKMSQNLFAESVLQAMHGPANVRSLLTEWGVPGTAIAVADGSGLSRYNLATADALVTVLTKVYRDERLRGPFEAALPVAGRDGTLAARMTETAAAGNARAKTGAFSNARSLSGYVETADGEPLVFSIIANNYGTTADAIERASDAIVVKLAEFSRR